MWCAAFEWDTVLTEDLLFIDAISCEGTLSVSTEIFEIVFQCNAVLSVV